MSTEWLKMLVVALFLSLAACSGDGFKATGGTGCSHCGAPTEETEGTEEGEEGEEEEGDEKSEFEIACDEEGGTVRDATDEEITEGVDTDGKVCSDGNGGIYLPNS